MAKMLLSYRSILGIWILERQSSRLSLWNGYFSPRALMSANVGFCIFIHSTPLLAIVSNCLFTSDISKSFSLVSLQKLAVIKSVSAFRTLSSVAGSLWFSSLQQCATLPCQSDQVLTCSTVSSNILLQLTRRQVDLWQDSLLHGQLLLVVASQCQMRRHTPPTAYAH